MPDNGNPASAPPRPGRALHRPASKQPPDRPAYEGWPGGGPEPSCGPLNLTSVQTRNQLGTASARPGRSVDLHAGSLQQRVTARNCVNPAFAPRLPALARCSSSKSPSRPRRAPHESASIFNSASLPSRPVPRLALGPPTAGRRVNRPGRCAPRGRPITHW